MSYAQPPFGPYTESKRSTIASGYLALTSVRVAQLDVVIELTVRRSLPYHKPRAQSDADRLQERLQILQRPKMFFSAHQV